MTFRESEREEDRLELTPLIDCIFLLLIFFLVTTSFYKLERELTVNLPQSSEGEAREKEPPSEIIINVLKDGTLYVNRVEKSYDELLQVLTDAVEKFPGIPVIIRGDELAYHKV
ncbi:MAG: biopolymer transporter ExbD, partial [Phycisphaerae bacterium]|nr:biopolymer transporter ExbD [Phycisphaerae bacterium]